MTDSPRGSNISPKKLTLAFAITLGLIIGLAVVQLATEPAWSCHKTEHGEACIWVTKYQAWGG